MNQLLPDPEKNEDVHFPGIDFDRILNRNSFVTFFNFYREPFGALSETKRH